MPWCASCHSTLFYPLDALTRKYPTAQADAGDEQHVARFLNLVSGRKFKLRLQEFAGSAIRTAELAANPEAYDLADVEHWDPEIRAEWDRIDRRELIAMKAAEEAYQQAYAAAEQAEAAA